MSLHASSIGTRRFAATVMLSTIGFFTWSVSATPEGDFAFNAPAVCPTRADARGLQSSELPLAKQVYVPWFDAALIGRIQTPSIGPLRLEGQAEVGSGLVTHRFRFDEPNAAVFKVRPGAALAARVGIVVPL